MLGRQLKSDGPNSTRRQVWNFDRSPSDTQTRVWECRKELCPHRSYQSPLRMLCSYCGNGVMLLGWAFRGTRALVNDAQRSMQGVCQLSQLLRDPSAGSLLAGDVFAWDMFSTLCTVWGGRARIHEGVKVVQMLEDVQVLDGRSERDLAVCQGGRCKEAFGENGRPP